VVQLCSIDFVPTNEKNWGHVRLKPDLWEKLKQIAKAEDRTLRAVLERALEKYTTQKEENES